MAETQNEECKYPSKSIFSKEQPRTGVYNRGSAVGAAGGLPTDLKIVK